MPSTTDTPDLGRRTALGFLAAAGAAALVAACGGSDDGGAVAADPSTTTTAGGSGSTAATSAAATSTTAAASSSSSGTVEVGGPIPEETAGPYPGDGTNGPNILVEDGVVRSDITSSLGGGGVADGLPLTVELTLADAASGAVLPGATVYLWHCDRDGGYSMYGGVAEETWCRGVQAADADGRITFTSIFPAAYDGRWPHIHFEVFDSLDQATSGRNAVRTSQLALPEDVCDEVYASVDGYGSSASNLDRTSLTSDMVFRDGVDLQLATVSGDTSSGYTASLVVGI